MSELGLMNGGRDERRLGMLCPLPADVSCSASTRRYGRCRHRSAKLGRPCSFVDYRLPNAHALRPHRRENGDLRHAGSFPAVAMRSSA